MPKQPFNSGGRRGTGQFRVRNRLIGAVLEEKHEYSDGCVRWEASLEPILMPKVASGYIAGLRSWATGRCRMRNGLLGAVIEQEIHDPGDYSTARWIRLYVPILLLDGSTDASR